MGWCEGVIIPIVGCAPIRPPVNELFVPIPKPPPPKEPPTPPKLLVPPPNNPPVGAAPVPPKVVVPPPKRPPAGLAAFPKSDPPVLPALKLRGAALVVPKPPNPEVAGLFIPELKRPPPVAAVLVLRPKFENGVLAVEVAPKFGRLVTLENEIQWRSEIHLFEVNKIVEISCHEII